MWLDTLDSTVWGESMHEPVLTVRLFCFAFQGMLLLSGTLYCLSLCGPGGVCGASLGHCLSGPPVSVTCCEFGGLLQW